TRNSGPARISQSIHLVMHHYTRCRSIYVNLGRFWRERTEFDPTEIAFRFVPRATRVVGCAVSSPDPCAFAPAPAPASLCALEHDGLARVEAFALKVGGSPPDRREGLTRRVGGLDPKRQGRLP